MKPLFYIGAVAATFMFWSSGIAKTAHFSETLGEMAHFGLNPPWVFALGTIALQLVGSALVVLGGRFAWLGAAALALFTLATIPIGHAFWNLPPQAAFGERLIAEEHLSVVGGLVLAAALGRGYGLWPSHDAKR
jgi:transmembrane protein